MSARNIGRFVLCIAIGFVTPMLAGYSLLFLGVMIWAVTYEGLSEVNTFAPSELGEVFIVSIKKIYLNLLGFSVLIAFVFAAKRWRSSRVQSVCFAAFAGLLTFAATLGFNIFRFGTDFLNDEIVPTLMMIIGASCMLAGAMCGYVLNRVFHILDRRSNDTKPA
ncbi:MAG: hypothetical protein AAF585_26205 [Verrucomicrobiota bacterium]